jgi:hypothetical protein
VNLLGILVALNASVPQDSVNGYVSSYHWPDYGSTVIFELVKDDEIVPEQNKRQNFHNNSDIHNNSLDNDVFVNIYYNTKPLAVKFCPSNISKTAVGNDRMFKNTEKYSMRLTDLIAISTQL